jgi:hypothetical protein
MRIQTSGCGTNFVAESLDGHSLLSPSWKIPLPLYSKSGLAAAGLPAGSVRIDTLICTLDLAEFRWRQLSEQRAYKHRVQ